MVDDEVGVIPRSPLLVVQLLLYLFFLFDLDLGLGWDVSLLT